MIDRYKIEEVGDKYQVIETGYEPLKLAECDTYNEARREVNKWKARDDLAEKVSEFIDEMIDNFGTVLEEREIREIIKGG